MSLHKPFDQKSLKEFKRYRDYWVCRAVDVAEKAMLESGYTDLKVLEAIEKLKINKNRR